MRWYLAAAVLFAPAAGVSGQTNIIELQRVRTLGRDTDSVMLGPNSSIARLSNGTYVAAVSDRTGRYTGLAMYSGDGEVTRTFGRPGDGPGEFRQLTVVRAGPGDTVYAYDRSHRMLSVLTSDLSLVAETTIGSPPIEDFLFTAEGTIAAHGYMASREAAGWPLHFVNSSGVVSKSFGADTPYFDPRPYAMNGRTIAARPSGGLCSSYVSQYRIQCWDRTGRKTIDILQEFDWFPPFELYTPGMWDTKRVQTAIWTIGVDNADRAWVSIEVVDPNWKYRRPEDRPPPGESGPGNDAYITDLERFVDSKIEVVDLKSGAVIASHSDGGFAVRFIGGSTLVRPRETPLGAVVFDVYEARLVPRPR